ncbi:hypothetical protein B0H66DRAFT_526379 [Apodospora peruviana]|uniref:Uncharacterized protein n=1 Tax=Apodospora peruviana TaxID=516989 RepID=A0AAE0IR25_9PEZI|nr:hypothetical protein B0H66DRAFT_526379 [Apodospora peruviana]
MAQQSGTTANSRPPAPASFQQQNQDIVTRWTNYLVTPLPDIQQDIDAARNQRPHQLFHRREFGSIWDRYIVQNASIMLLLSSTPQARPKNYVIHLDSESNSPAWRNTLSKLSARIVYERSNSRPLTTEPSSAQPYQPALAYFCRQHTAEGLHGLLQSLIYQLMAFITRHRPSVDLQPVEGMYYFRSATNPGDLTRGMGLFRKLVGELPRGDQVYIAIDDYSAMNHQPDEYDANLLMRALGQVMADNKGHVPINMLVTNAPDPSDARIISDLLCTFKGSQGVVDLKRVTNGPRRAYRRQ